MVICNLRRGDFRGRPRGRHALLKAVVVREIPKETQIMNCKAKNKVNPSLQTCRHADTLSLGHTMKTLSALELEISDSGDLNVFGRLHRSRSRNRSVDAMSPFPMSRCTCGANL